MDRMKELREALDELDARQIACHDLKPSVGKNRLDVYVIPNAGIIMVQISQMRKDDPESWDVFVPVSTSTKTDETITALKQWTEKAALSHV